MRVHRDASGARLRGLVLDAQRAGGRLWYGRGPVMSVDLPTGSKQGAGSTLERSSAAANRAGDERPRPLIPPIMFLAGTRCVGLDVLTAGVATE